MSQGSSRSIGESLQEPGRELRPALRSLSRARILAAALLALLVPGAAPAQGKRLAPTDTSGAYLDSSAADIVRRARAWKAAAERSLMGYRVIARERFGIGIRALRRDRIFFHHEVAARVEWRRGEQTRIEVLGARSGMPVVGSEPVLPQRLNRLVRDLAFDPEDNFLTARPVRRSSNDEPYHPLSPGSERHFRFRSGDTTALSFPDGRTIRVLELVIIPRRADFWLFGGSLWFDAETYGLVRMVVRPSRPFDVDLDLEESDRRDIPGFVKPLRADVRQFTVEYGLQAFRWWLPRLVSFDGVATAGPFGSMPIRFERVYTEYQVDGGEGLPLARTIELPEATRPAPRRRTGGLAAAMRDVDIDLDFFGGVGRANVLLPENTAVLLESPFTPPSLFEPGQELISEADLRDLGRAVGLLPNAVWQPGTRIRWALTDPRLVRYNRVEGLSMGVRLEAPVGRLALDAAARLGWADLLPNADVALVHATTGARLRLAGYHRLSPVDDAARAFGVGGSLNALLLGRDDGDYFRAAGIEVTGAAAGAGAQWYSWRLHAERQRAAAKETDASLRRVLQPSHRFRAGTPAARADQLGAALALRGRSGLDPARLMLGADMALEASVGDYRFAKGALTARAGFPLPLGLAAALEAAGGSAVGEVPPQSLWYLGGPATLRGYAGGAATGDAFWRARGELAVQLLGGRIAAFGDAGWAGPRADFGAGAQLLSVGVGGSLLDGLIRLDVARALRAPRGWRADLYWDAPL